MQDRPTPDMTLLPWSVIDYRPVSGNWSCRHLAEHLKPGSQVTELGCGRGESALELARSGYSVYGLDVNRDAISGANRRAAEEGLAHRARFDSTDFLTGPAIAQADAVVMIRVLTCLPDDRDWLTALRLARDWLKTGGVLYIRDFMTYPSVYGARYSEGSRAGLGPGRFFVPVNNGQSCFVARHHSERDLEKIREGYKVKALNFIEGLSMNGNPVSTFEFIGRKA